MIRGLAAGKFGLASGLVVVALLWLGSCAYDTLEKIPCTNPPTSELISVIGTECGQATGSVTVAGSGGTGALAYSIDGINFQQTGIFEGLAAEVFEVTTKDDYGCISILEVAVGNINGFEVTATSTPAGCGTSNGVATINVKGGVEPFEFNMQGRPLQAEPTFSGLSVGSYDVIVRDAEGCSIQSKVSVLSGKSFSEIKSIISANCATSTCHGGRISPDFRNNNNIQVNAQKIATLTANGNIPPLGGLSNGQLQSIACWVEDGAPLN